MAISTAVDLSAVARVVGIAVKFVDLRGSVAFLPQRIAVFGQGNTLKTYPTTKWPAPSALETAQRFGFGSPLHLAMEQLLPSNGDGVGTIPITLYPMEDNAASVASSGDITPSGSVTVAEAYTVLVNNIPSAQFVVAVGDAVADMVTSATAAINAALNVPIIATDSATTVDFISKWEGASANGIIVSISGPATASITWVVTQASGGLVNPVVTTPLAQMGNIWETLVLNCLDITDATALTDFSTFGEGRWGALVKKPLVVFTGNPAATPAAAIVVPDARKTDRVNSQLVSPGSVDLPFVTAGRQLARIASLANNNPPHDYAAQQATGLTPGADFNQWDDLERDTAVKGGSSTIEVIDSVVELSDTITFYHPSGDVTPAYRYVVDIIKLQQIIFNTSLIFEAAGWKGAPLIPDDQPTANRTAKKPKHAIAAVAGMIDSLALEAILSDPETAKGTILAGINATNPKRLDVAYTVQLSGNTNIISVDLNFGFFFGTVAAAA